MRTDKFKRKSLSPKIILEARENFKSYQDKKDELNLKLMNIRENSKLALERMENSIKCRNDT